MVRGALETGQRERARLAREQDKRYFPRWEVNKRVEYDRKDGGGDAFRSYTKDLSLEGTSILVVGHPPVRHRVQLRIYLTDKENFEARGHVAWSRSEPTHEVFGIVFDHLSEKAGELITQHAFEPKDNPALIPGLIDMLVLNKKRKTVRF